VCSRQGLGETAFKVPIRQDQMVRFWFFKIKILGVSHEGLTRKAGCILLLNDFKDR